MERSEKRTVSAKYCDGKEAKPNKHWSKGYKQSAYIYV